MEFTPFTIAIPDADLADLRERLGRTRWPDAAPGDTWDYGIPLGYLKDLASYWRDGYDWRAQETKLNAYPQFTTEIDGQQIYFIHARSPEPDALPLILIHGWPGSTVEFLDLLDPLTDPRAHGGDPATAFHVVVPALPGYGFSGPTTAPGWDTARIARAFVALMAGLGHERYGAHGGDWGSFVAREMGRIDAEHVVGVHLTMLSSAVPQREPSDEELDALDPAERERTLASWRQRSRFGREELGYATVQMTKPQTLAPALADSPVGQLAWIIEKFHGLTDNNGLPEDAVDRDHLLTNVMHYWLTNTAGSSARLYYAEAHAGGEWGAPPAPSTTPTAFALFPRDSSLAVRHLAERTNNVIRWTEFDRGGHFAGLEEPDLLLGDLRAFFHESIVDGRWSIGVRQGRSAGC